MNMNHAKKMALVDPRFLPTQPYVRRMSDLDERMKDILERSDLNEIEKVKLYNQALQKYIIYEDQSHQPPPPIRVTLNDDEKRVEDIAINTRDMDAEVLESVPKNYKKKVSLLLDRLKRNQNLSWNENGEMVYKGQVHPNSNILDLVNDIVRKRKDFNPTGWQTFAEVLREMNIPRELVGNLDRWQMINTTPSTSTPKKRYTQQRLWPGQIKRWSPY